MFSALMQKYPYAVALAVAVAGIRKYGISLDVIPSIFVSLCLAVRFTFIPVHQPERYEPYDPDPDPKSPCTVTHITQVLTPEQLDKFYGNAA